MSDMFDIHGAFRDLGEYMAAGMYEDPDRSVFYRLSKGLRRYWEECALPAYEGKLLYPSGALDKSAAVIPCFMAGVQMSGDFAQAHPDLARQFRADFKKYESYVPYVHTVGTDMALHSLPYYERVLREGILSYIPRIEKIEDKEMREGLLEIVAGIQKYHARALTYLQSVGADADLLEAFAQVPLYPARNVYEAILSWNFVMYLDGCDDLGCVASGIQPYHKGENVVPLLENLYDNLDINNGYSMALHCEDTDLTLQCLEASKGRRRPQVELLVDENTPDEIWHKAFESMRTGNGQPAYYNKKVLYEGLSARVPSIRPEDLKLYCGVGCTESSLSGLSNVGSGDTGINLLWILSNYIAAHLSDEGDFEDFYAGYIAEVRKETDHVLEAISKSQLSRAQHAPLPMRALLVDDCIDKGLDFNNGGPRYCWSLVYFAAISNVLDSLLVIRDLVFREQKYTKKQFAQQLFQENEAFLQECRNHPVHHGIDDPDANAFASRLTTDLYSYLDGKKPAIGEAFIPAAIMFRSMAIHGKNVPATPDGRHAGDPLADSLGAVIGKDTKGPTALLNSVTSMNLARALGIPVLNFRIDPTISDANMKALVMGYMASGGIQMQVTCIDPALLQEAYEHPELHRNLVVRVGGYSDYFYNLSDELKRMVIARNVHK